jgi:hypothetical protein
MDPADGFEVNHDIEAGSDLTQALSIENKPVKRYTELSGTH